MVVLKSVVLSFKDKAVKIVLDRFASFPKLVANSCNELRFSGAVPIKFENALSTWVLV